MLDTSEDYAICEREIGQQVAQLMTPLTRFSWRGRFFGIDNGFYTTPDPVGLFALLEREREHKQFCKFVAVPDVPGDARRTDELFREFWPKLNNWPLALVAQNGLENLPVPWSKVAAIFIGGLDLHDGRGDWKMSIHAENVIRAARALGKWVHVGRVNSAVRWEHFDDLGADSADGTGIAKYTVSRWRIKNGKLQGKLFPPPNGREGQVVSGDSVGLDGAAPVLDSVRQDTEGPRSEVV